MSLPHVFCIGLLDQPWRLELAKSHLNRLGLAYSVVYGFNGVAVGLRPAHPYDFLADGTPQYMRPTQIGCGLSHLAALNQALAAGYSEFIVVEDDVQFEPSIIERWNIARHTFPDDLGIVHLAYCCHEDKPKKAINEHISECFYPFGETAIWWKRETALFALSAMQPLYTASDIMLATRVLPFVRNAIFTPALAFNRSVVQSNSAARF